MGAAFGRPSFVSACAHERVALLSWKAPRILPRVLFQRSGCDESGDPVSRRGDRGADGIGRAAGRGGPRPMGRRPDPGAHPYRLAIRGLGLGRGGRARLPQRAGAPARPGSTARGLVLALRDARRRLRRANLDSRRARSRQRPWRPVPPRTGKSRAPPPIPHPALSEWEGVAKAPLQAPSPSEGEGWDGGDDRGAAEMGGLYPHPNPLPARGCRKG